MLKTVPVCGGGSDLTVAGSTWMRAGRRFFLIIFFFFGAPSATADSAGWVTARAFSSLATCSSGVFVSSREFVGSTDWGGSATVVCAMAVVVGLRLEIGGSVLTFIGL